MQKPKSIHELRSIAQAKGIKFSFADDVLVLAQKIAMVNDAMAAKAPPPIQRPEYDPRLRNKPPGKECTQVDMLARLQEHIARGLLVTFPMPEQWHMKRGDKEDTGTMRMPPKVMLDAADRMMR